jgi:hypothetical protein
VTPLDRLIKAVYLMTGYGGQCWVCANRGHHHLSGVCREDRCPCARRKTGPTNPVWVQVRT